MGRLPQNKGKGRGTGGARSSRRRRRGRRREEEKKEQQLQEGKAPIKRMLALRPGHLREHNSPVSTAPRRRCSAMGLRELRLRRPAWSPCLLSACFT